MQSKIQFCVDTFESMKSCIGKLEAQIVFSMKTHNTSNSKLDLSHIRKNLVILDKVANEISQQMLTITEVAQKEFSK